MVLEGMCNERRLSLAESTYYWWNNFRRCRSGTTRSCRIVEPKDRSLNCLHRVIGLLRPLPQQVMGLARMERTGNAQEDAIGILAGIRALLVHLN